LSRKSRSIALDFEAEYICTGMYTRPKEIAPFQIERAMVVPRKFPRAANVFNTRRIKEFRRLRRRPKARSTGISRSDLCDEKRTPGGETTGVVSRFSPSNGVTFLQDKLA